ncbi:MAG TPA: gamma-glutamyltransferase, partial [Candidatus Binatia bacterium]|nr:gamma-glutamyltransferase [Candidatus Binatia bacterium]
IHSFMVLRNRIPGLFFFFFFLLVVGTFPSFAQRQSSGVVASDNELATNAGLEILQRGGNAVDAAVAAAFALAVVDPASSGIGGGGFMVIYQMKEKKAHALDFRETAPAAAHRDLYIKGGKPIPALTLTGALAVAVPGEIAGLAEALKRFGSLPLATVMAPAIHYAAEGFPLRPYLRSTIERQLPTMRKFPDLARLFLSGESVPAEGERIRQPELGETLKAIAAEGPAVFYQGWVGQAIADTIKKEGGVLTLEDLKGYRPVWREPLIGRYRKQTVITMSPPSSGGIALVQMLNVLEGFKLNLFPHNSATYLHLIAETMKHAFADRAQYLGDPDFVQLPIQKLSSRDYAAWIRSQISSVQTHRPSFYGLASFKPEKGGTTHLSVIDGAGNAVSCTLTINTQFGSKVVVPGTGIILNNEMDDFSIQQGAPNVYKLIGADANLIQPKKRPLSSMAPTIILQGERPVLVVGGSGGPRIISATLQTILNVLDFRMPLRKAIEAPRIHHQWMPNEIVVEREIPEGTRKSLERRGHAVREGSSLGVVQAVLAERSKISAEADPRKEEKSRSE